MSDYRDLMEPVPTSVVITCLQEELSRMRTALEEIAAVRGKRLDGHARCYSEHEIRAYETASGKAFDECATIAERALAPEGRALTAGSGNE